MNFKVGDRVVCVNGDKSGSLQTRCVLIYPKKGHEYTIRGFHPIYEGLYLEEVNNSNLSHRTRSGSEPSFKYYRFRKIELDYNFVEEVIKNVTPKEEVKN